MIRDEARRRCPRWRTRRPSTPASARAARTRRARRFVAERLGEHEEEHDRQHAAPMRRHVSRPEERQERNRRRSPTRDREPTTTRGSAYPIADGASTRRASAALPRATTAPQRDEHEHVQVHSSTRVRVRCARRAATRTSAEHRARRRPALRVAQDPAFRRRLRRARWPAKRCSANWGRSTASTHGDSETRSCPLKKVEQRLGHVPERHVGREAPRRAGAPGAHAATQEHGERDGEGQR
jgi:hypothetical protein